MRRLVILFLALFILALLSGCGGGGVKIQTTHLAQTIQWGERSRALDAPSSALSCVVELSPTVNDSGNPTHRWILERQDTPGAYTQHWTSPDAITVGPWYIVVKFYAEHGGQGSMVAQAGAAITVALDGSTSEPIALVGSVTAVEVTPGQIADVNGQNTLAFTARNQNTILALSAGSAFWTLTSGADVMQLAANGTAQGLDLGTATVTASVDGVTSAPVDVRVQPTQMLAFTRQESATASAIYLSFLDGSAPRKIVDAGKDPSFSPDGAFVVYSDAQGQLQVYDLFAEQTLNDNLGAGVSPVFVKNGQHIASLFPTLFYNGTLSSNTLEVMTRDGVNLWSYQNGITPVNALATNATGAEMLVASPNFFGDSIWSVNATDGTFYQLLASTPDVSYATPALSPDGNRAAAYRQFASSELGTNGIITADVASGNAQLVLADVQPDRLAFSPDGQTLMYSVHNGSAWSLYTIPVTGGSPTPVTTGNDHQPAWWGR